MKSKFYIAAAVAAAALLTAGTASAQFLGKEDNSVTAPKLAMPYWSAKPTELTPYVAPNKPHWKLSEILAMHKGQTDWVQPIVRNREQDADYISLGAGKTQKARFYADDRVVFIVWDGQLKVSIEGKDPFVATKGFMVNIPYRNIYTLQTVGDKPSLRFEVRQAGSPPLFPATVTPDPFPGITYIKVTGQPGPNKDKDSNPTYVDFFKQVAIGDKPYSDKFVWDDHFTSNILRGKAAPIPPDTNKGHFHVDWTEFWFVMEGSIGIKIEGVDYFKTEPGDIITAAKGRWHRAGDDPSAPMSTRIPFNPRPTIMHNFEIED
jgi:mannose-6-phosphate isomerase-like protein (cupin superfamily)